ncbi:Gfo/Idh/MocA family protein [Paenibacillus sp. D51F]
MILKIIQVGLGAHGRGVGSNFILPSVDFEYAGLVDLNMAALEDFAGEHGLSSELLDTDYKYSFSTREADAVFITAISPSHYEIAKEALEQGLHVLIEKPFVLSMEHAVELVQLAEDKQRIIMISQNYRFVSPVVTLKQTIDQSSLGQMRFVNTEFFINHEGKGYQREMDNFILMEMSVHHIDMIRFLLESNIVSVWGRTWNYLNSGYKGDPNVHAVYQTEKGVPFFYTSSLLARGPRLPWEGKWRLQFDHGVIYMDDLGEGYGVYVADSNGTLTKIPTQIPEHESIHGVLFEFAQSIRENREPATSGRDNLNTIKALLATSESSILGREIQL